MHRVAPAIILSVRPHGEHGAIVRALTREDGVQPGYVRGGRSRALRPVLQPGNGIIGEWRARTVEQLAALTIEPGHSRAGLHGEPLAAAGIEWLCALTAAALPEEQPYPVLYDALDAVLTAIESAPSARGWAGALVRYELLLLGAVGVRARSGAVHRHRRDDRSRLCQSQERRGGVGGGGVRVRGAAVSPAALSA
ncbi:DNA repair protein RecO [Sphingomonas sp. SORGH_AS_0742]|uniref:DNA repair protein RecO n=1 Tax=Sphingomonas sp. SORGH_AS_0742 TaxID=3041797 RepID=UPI003867960F